MDQNLIIFLIVVGLRLIVPLFIPRFPLPAIILCLVIDGMDQTIFQKYTTIDLSGYQSYDKALDIYYLSIAYLSTFKNWTNHAAFQVAQFLFYYRMIGVVLYENFHLGQILFIFPNTFEYFFIFYSVLALRYKMTEFKGKFFVLAAAFIWIFIKLPQEYWIHIAHLDTTDLIRAFFAEYGNNIPVLIGVFAAFAVFIGFVLFLLYLFIKRLPKPDHKFTFRYEKIKKIEFSFPSSYKNLMKVYKKQLAEKIIFVSLITVIFASIFPSFNGSNLNIILGVTFVIIANSICSYIILKSKNLSNSLIENFVFMFILNTVIIVVFINIINKSQEINLTVFGVILFLAYILTLITHLYDKYWPYYYTRFVKFSQK